MGKTSKSAWTGFERRVARSDWDSDRNPLSGANNKDDGGAARPGDVILDYKVWDHLVECKFRAKHAHHALHRAAQEDAKKHKRDPKLTVLYTKQKHEIGHLVVITGDLFTEILQVPGVKELFKKKQQGS